MDNIPFYPYKEFFRYVKVALSFPINKLIKFLKTCFKKLAYIYYNKWFLWRNLCWLRTKNQNNIRFSTFKLSQITKKYEWRAWTRKIVHLGKGKFRNDTTNTFEIGRHRPSGWVRTGCLRTIDVMEMSIFNNHHGVVPRRQVGAVPGDYGPSQATGTADSRQEAGMGQSRATSFNLRMLHWNAEWVRNKKLELQVFLKERT